MRIKQAVCIPPLRPAAIGLEDFVKACADIGFAAVEMWDRSHEFEHVLELAPKHGLKIVSLLGFLSAEEGLNKRANHDRLEDELRASIDVAAANDIRGIVAFSGNRYEGVSDAEAIEITAEGLQRIAPYAEEKGVYVNLELLNSKVDHIGYQCDRTAWGVEVVKRVNSPRVRLLYDIYHMQIMEGDIIRTIRDNIEWIAHFHTAGNPDRYEPGDDQELNYTGICKAIAQTGYDGYVGHEFKGRGDVIEVLKDTFSRCNQR